GGDYDRRNAMTKQSRKNLTGIRVLLVVCAGLALVLLYVAVEIVREYNEFPSAAMFGIPGLLFAAAAITCVVTIGRSKKAAK
ncbi:MAG: hypothetical protein ABIR91_01080, partial [Candidatus Saccharimonadales bacterium]